LLEKARENPYFVGVSRQRGRPGRGCVISPHCLR
jgi:hypothetical protein